MTAARKRMTAMPGKRGEFERIRDAYEDLRDPRRRSRRMLVAVDPEAQLVSLLDDTSGTRRFVGPDAWWLALKER